MVLGYLTPQNYGWCLCRAQGSVLGGWGPSYIKHRIMAYHPNLGYESFKVTENGTIQYTAYEFLFVFHCNYGHSSVVSFARNSETFVDNRDFSYTFYITTPSLRKNGEKYFHAVFSFSKPSLIPGLWSGKVVCLLKAKARHRQTDRRKCDLNSVTIAKK